LQHTYDNMSKQVGTRTVRRDQYAPVTGLALLLALAAGRSQPGVVLGAEVNGPDFLPYPLPEQPVAARRPCRPREHRRGRPRGRRVTGHR